MARDFDGNAEATRKAAVARLARIVAIDSQKLKPQAQVAFADFATVLSLVQDLDRWLSDDKDALRAIIAAKSARTELHYQQLLIRHERLRRAILQIGSRTR
jgi:hypothetical protein